MYITSDPIGQWYNYSNPQLQVVLGMRIISANLCGYANQNPTVLIDPYGFAGKGNGAVGVAIGKGAKNKYRYCREVPGKNKIICWQRWRPNRASTSRVFTACLPLTTNTAPW
jgi:hypothetical protein